jgi:hypothetical protein
MALALVASACAAAPSPALAPTPTPTPTPTPVPTLTPTLTPARAPAPVSLSLAIQRTSEAFSAALKAHDPAQLGSLYAPDACLKMPGRPDLCTSAIDPSLESIWVAFPDERSAWSRTWRKGDVAIVESAWTGTNEGPGPGASKKPTHKVAGAATVTLTWFTPEGRIHEQHVYGDEASVLMQLGIEASGHPFDGLPTSRERHEATFAASEEDNVARIKGGLVEQASAFANDAELVDFAHAGSLPTKKGAPRWIAMRTAALVKPKVTYAHLFGIEEAVIAEYEVAGGGRRGEPATLHGVEVLELADGKVKRAVRYRDSLELAPVLALPLPVPSLGGMASGAPVAVRSPAADP